MVLNKNSSRRVRQPRERGPFECWVTGEKGMFVGTVEAESNNPDMEAVRVIYIPFQDLNQGWFRSWLSRIEYFEKEYLWKVTQARYPRHAVIEQSNKGFKKSAGHFDREFKAVHDLNGEHPWLEEQWNQGVQKTVERIQKRNKRLENKLSEAEIEMTGMVSEDDVTTSKPKTGSGNRENRDSRYDFEEF